MAETSPAPGKSISVRGARDRNLKAVDCGQPIRRTGLPGFGQSPSAFAPPP